MTVGNGNMPVVENRPISEKIVTKIADIEGVEPTQLEPPLYESINPDALDDLFASITSGDARVEFTSHGYEITVTSDGAVSVSSSTHQ